MASSAAVAALLGAALTAGGLGDEAGRVPPHAERLFRTADGLPQATVNAIAQTPDGYLWLGTDGGLGRFDGSRFVAFTSDDTPALRLDRVQALVVDDAGALWVGTHGGAGLARLRGGEFETFEDRIGTGSRVVSAHRGRDGTLWFGRSSDVVRFRRGRFEVLRRLGSVEVSTVGAFAEERDGTLWVGMLTGLVRFREGKVRLFTRADGELLTPVTALATDAADRVWGGTERGALFRVDEGEPHAIPVAETRSHRAVRSLHADSAGVLWAATDGGLMRVDDRGLHPACARCASGGEPARTVVEDREGNLWVGTHGAGLVRITRAVFETIALDGITTRRALSVLESSDGDVWIGTDGSGLVRAKGDGRTLYTTAQHALCTDFVWAIAEDGAGGIWIGGEHGGGRVVCRLDAATGAVRTLGPAQGLPQGAVRALTVTRDGTLWIGTMRALYRLEDDRVVRVPIPTAPNEQMPVYAIHEDQRGVLRVGGSDGLHARAGDRWTALRSSDGLSNSGVFSIDEEPGGGGLWLGTLRGFSLVRAGRAHGYRREQGFRDEPVWKAIADGVGRLWLCSPRGLVSVSLVERVPRPDGATVYRGGTGLPADQCEGGEGQGAGYRARSGRLLFPAGRNVVVIDPRRALPVPTRATPLIEAARVDGTPVRLAGLAQLPPGRGDLQIEYTAPGLTRPDRLRFRYRLSPLDADWVDAGHRRVALYTKVPPGRYQFEVLAAVDGNWAEAPSARLAVNLEPHLHQRRGFQALLAAVVLALAAVGVLVWHRRRMRTLEHQHELVLAERTRIARDLHDTLAQGFTGISVQLEAASGWFARSEASRAHENLDRARALVRTSLVDARRAVWDLPPEALARGGVVPALTEITRAFADTVPVRLQVDGRPRRLSDGVEAALVRIGQEALTNAVRHASARNVAVELAFVDREVRLRVWDDGRGFVDSDGASGPDHHGLAGIRARAAAVGAALEVKSAPGAGTQIIVTVTDPGGTS